ncbi:MAG: hypothetical protein WCV55_03375 [Candidatus Paceibacterota bacterium]
MEKQPYQEYRDELADKLNEIRDAGEDSEDPKSKINRANAEGYLDGKKEDSFYRFSKYKHQKEDINKEGAEELQSVLLDSLNNLKEKNELIRVERVIGFGSSAPASISTTEKDYKVDLSKHRDLTIGSIFKNAKLFNLRRGNLDDAIVEKQLFYIELDFEDFYDYEGKNYLIKNKFTNRRIYLDHVGEQIVKSLIDNQNLIPSEFTKLIGILVYSEGKGNQEKHIGLSYNSQTKKWDKLEAGETWSMGHRLVFPKYPDPNFNDTDKKLI